MPFPEMNLKQAWLLPSATALPNPNGTAPGWWVSRPDGGLIVALPGPPREMTPMWTEHALPRLRERGAGTDVVHRTLRLAGIGESQVADLLGEALLRTPDPVVATYARADAVDVRISARGAGPDGSSAADRVAATADRVLAVLGDHVWAEGATTWPEAIEAALGPVGGSLSVVEVVTGGSFAALLGDRPWLRFGEIPRRGHGHGASTGERRRVGAPGAAGHGARGGGGRRGRADAAARRGHRRIGRGRGARLESTASAGWSSWAASTAGSGRHWRRRTSS